MKFRKKPVVIEAIQFLGAASFDEMVRDWGQPFINVCGFFAGSPLESMDMSIKTLEGTMEARIGDWIIRGVKGEFYPCKNDIFEATYELVTPSIAENIANVFKNSSGTDQESVHLE